MQEAEEAARDSGGRDAFSRAKPLLFQHRVFPPGTPDELQKRSKMYSGVRLPSLNSRFSIGPVT